MAENYIFIGQTFLKVKPIDRLREMQMCAEDMYDLAEDYTRLAKKGTLSDNEKKAYDEMIDMIKKRQFVTLLKTKKE